MGHPTFVAGEGNPVIGFPTRVAIWDDEAKVPGLRVPNAAYYLPMLQAASRLDS